MLQRLSDTPLGRFLGLEQKDVSLAGRALILWRRNPQMLQTILRDGYRRKIGIALDRGWRRGVSGPPVNLSLNLTRRCNLKCLMCEQHRHQDGAPPGLSWYDHAQELPLTAWTSLLSEVTAFGPRLYLTGGEPLLYRDGHRILIKVRGGNFYDTNKDYGNRICNCSSCKTDLYNQQA